MLNENIKTLRKAKGLSQEELAVRLNVVRQTVSKWENGLSVPDADMLIDISMVLDTSVSTLLGENVAEEKADDMKVIAAKLESINLQLSNAKRLRRKILHWSFIVLCAVTVICAILLFFAKSPYLNWNYADPETAVIGTAMHVFEFTFVRIAPFILLGTIVGIVLTRDKRNGVC